MNWKPSSYSSIQSPSALVAKRYGWFRHRNGLVWDPRWALVEQKTGVGRAIVSSIVMYLLECANMAYQRRGSLEDFSPELCAVALGLDVGQVTEVYRALALPSVGFIDQDFVVEWHLIQREKEDPTSTERSRRRRARLKREREEAALRGLSVARNGGADVAATPTTPLPNDPSDQTNDLDQP